MASKKHDCNVQRAAQNSLHLTTCSPLWLDLSKCLKTLVPLTQTLSYTNLSEAEKQYCRNSSLRTVTADCKNLFFSVLLRRRETKWEWRKCWEGIMISSAFSTSFQTNTAVPEVWWSKLFDLWHKKLLQETISTLGQIVLILLPNQGSCMEVALWFFPLKLHLSREFAFSVLKWQISKQCLSGERKVLHLLIQSK